MIYINQIFMLYTLNLYSAVYQLYLNKLKEKEEKSREHKSFLSSH